MLVNSSIETYFTAPHSSLNASNLESYIKETKTADRSRNHETNIQFVSHSTVVTDPSARKNTGQRKGLVCVDLSVLGLSKPVYVCVKSINR